MEFLDTLKKTINFIKPYFGLSYSNLPRTAALVTSFLTPVIDILILRFVSKTNSFNEEDDNNFSDRAVAFMTGSLLISISYSIKYSLNKYLAESLKKAIKLDHTHKLLDSQNKFLIGSLYISNSHNDKSTYSLQEVTIGKRIDSFVDSFVLTSLGQTVDIISIGASFYHMALVTGSYQIPKYASTLALMSGISTYKLEKLATEYTKREEKVSSILISRSIFIENNKDSITLIGATDFESNFFQKNILERQKEISKLLKVSFLSTFLSLLFNNIGSQFFDVLIPNHLLIGSDTIQKKFLNQIVSIFLKDVTHLSSIYARDYFTLDFDIDKLSEFRLLHDKWLQTFYSNNFLTKSFNKEYLSLQDFSVSINGEHVLYKASITLDACKVYRLAGESGCGKTTILKAMVGCWAFTRGDIMYPASSIDSICFIPQKFSLPPNFTLIESMVYPYLLSNFDQVSVYKKAELLLNKVNMSKFITRLNDREESWDTILSGGERQKILVIGAILKRPNFLIMDEAAANLDIKNKIDMYLTIKQSIPDCTILYTDHNNIEGFADNTIIISDHNLMLLGDSI
jgi:ABC-type uncharacterized transport system fused permease/ATPase subunit